jgi:hypothetical protein
LRRAPGRGELFGDVGWERQLHFDDLRAPLAGALRLLRTAQLLASSQGARFGSASATHDVQPSLI